MAITFTIEVPRAKATRAQLDEVRRLVGVTSDEQLPAGMLTHLESETPDGYRIVDVWETPADFERFFTQSLEQAFDTTGFHPLTGPPTPEPVISMQMRQGVAAYDEMVRALNDAFSRNDPAVFDRYLHPDFVEHEQVGDTPPTRDGVKQMVANMHQAFEGFAIDTLDVTSAPGRAACRSRLRGKHVGEFMGLPPTGRSVDIEALDYFTIGDDGLIREHWEAFDQALFMTQLGMAPQAAPATIQLPTETRV